MANRATAIAMDIIARDGASAVIKKVGTELKHTGDEAEKSGGGFSKFKAAGIAAGAAVGAAVIGFGKSAVDKFKEVGGETLGLMRIMGGTAESASRLRFAAQQSGVSFETLTKSTGKFEKGLGAANDGGKKAAAMIKTLGFDFRDAHGHIRPMTDVLPDLAEKFKKMPGGAEKTALAMKLFGKSGADMLPFLNKGKAGIQDLMKESDKFGNTLTGKNLDALKKSKASQREWNATLDGLKIQFGAQILPILNSFVGMVRDKVIPIVLRVTSFMSAHKDMVGNAAKIIAVLITGVKAWSIAQGILNVVLAANPITLVVLAIGALVFGLIYAYKHSETFRNIVNAAFTSVKTVALGVFNAVKGAVMFAVDFIGKHWKLIVALIGGPFVAVAILVATHWKQITDLTKRAKDTVTRLLTGFWNGITTAWNSMRTWINGRWAAFQSWIGGLAASATRWLGSPWFGFIRTWDQMRGWVNGRWSAFQGWIGQLAASAGRWLGSPWWGFVRSWDQMRGWINGRWSALQSWVGGLGGYIGRAAGGMWNGFTSAFRSAINGIIYMWNRLHFSIPGLSIAGVQVFGGANLSVPQIPYFAKGGIVTKPTLGMFGEAGPEAVVPLSRLGSGGDTIHITVNVPVGGDPVGTGREIVRMIKAYKSTTGGRNLGIA